MRKLVLIIIVFVSSPCNSGSATRQPDEIPREKLPTKLHAFIGGFARPSYRVDMVDSGHLVYYASRHYVVNPPDTDKTWLDITPQQWERFRMRLDAARVWEWKREYVNRDILDGTGWELEAAFPDRAVTSIGANNSPPKEQFDEFLAAVKELVGGRKFE